MTFDNPRAADAPQSPFPDSLPVLATGGRAPVPVALHESPFPSLYEALEGEAGDPQDEWVDELLEGLHDEEFDEAVAELTEELRAQAAARPEFEDQPDEQREAALRQTLVPLVRAAQADLARVAAAVGALDPAAGEAEIEGALEALPLPEVDSPAFEFFLKGLRNKVRKAVGQAARLARRGLSPALGLLLKPLLAKLRTLVGPLLEKVLKFALDKVPAAYRPLAVQLAGRLAGRARAAVSAPRRPAPAVATLDAAALAGTASPDAAPEPAATAEPMAPTPGDAPVPDQPATPDTSQAQAELDLELAEAALSDPQAEQEWVGPGPVSQPVAARDPYADLTRARARFVREITELGEADEAGPVIERFLPAVLMVVRQGVRLAGRERVVGALGGLIAKFVGPLVGRANAPALGKVLADVGLRTFLQAEVEPAAEMEAAGQALAATVEETVRRVAQLPDDVLDEAPALQAYAHEAFLGAAAANFPAPLVRAELRETEQAGVWVERPRRGRRRYRKFSHVFDVSVAPQVARAVHGYGSSTLAGHFRDRLRLAADRPVAARLHLYEAVPGTSLAAIARDEADVRGLGSSERSAWSQLQPLTPEAAGLLLGAPRLGRELSEEAEPELPSVGQRFYHLEIAQAPARPLGRESHLHAALDLRRGELRLCLFLSEVLAQQAAGALRAKTSPAVIVAELRSALAPAARSLARARSGRLVRVLGLRAPRPATLGPSQREARRALRGQVARLTLDWALRHLASRLDTLAAEFIAKTENSEDGLRLAFTFHVPGALSGLAGVLRGTALRAPGWPPAGAVRTTLTLHAGPRHA